MSKGQLLTTCPAPPAPSGENPPSDFTKTWQIVFDGQKAFCPASLGLA